MKTYSLLIIGLILILAIGLNGCKSNKPIIEQATNEESVAAAPENKPCEEEVYSDKNFFRTTSISTSSDLMLAKEKSLLLAKQRLVTIINSSAKSAISRYLSERGLNNPSEFQHKFETIALEAADEAVNNVAITCETASILPNKQSRTFVAIEISKEDILNCFTDKISNDSKLQLNYDEKRFKEIFYIEMAKEKGR